MLFRTVKRRTIWKEATAEIVDVEFQDASSGQVDLKPSFYVIEDHSVVQIAAEHVATASMTPQSTGPDYVDLVDAEGALASQCPTEPDIFSFASMMHHEVCFSSEADLVAFLDARRERWIRSKVQKWSVVDYAIARRKECDAEWDVVFRGTRGLEWNKKCDEREGIS